MQQIRRGHPIQDIARTLQEMANEDYYQKYLVAVAHHISHQEKALLSPAEYQQAEFSFPPFESSEVRATAPGSELIKNNLMKEMEDGYENYLRKQQQLLDGKGVGLECSL